MTKSKEKQNTYEDAVALVLTGYSIKHAADEVGVSDVLLGRHIKKLGLTVKRIPTNINFKHHRDICDKYLSSVASTVLGREYGCSSDAIISLLRYYGVEIRQKTELKFYKPGYTINRAAFEDTESEECAYYYGWLLTDGNLCKNRISIQVQRGDEIIIERIRSYVGTSNPILRRERFDARTQNTYYSSEVYFSDHVIKTRLQALGFKSRKSMLEVCPEVFKNNRHFWRGALEGDGYIVNNGRSFGIGMVGSLSFMTSFQDYCKSLGVQAKISYTNGNNDLHECTISNKAGSKVVLDSLYRDTTLYLPRKYNLYRDRYNGCSVSTN